MYGGCTRRRKELFVIAGRGWPDRVTMRSIKRALPGWYNIDVRHYLSWQWLAHPEGSRDRPADAVPCPARLLPARTCRRIPVLLSRPDLPWPTRQSDRQVADAPCNRRFVPRPDPGFACEAGASSGLPVPFKGGRSATRRVVSVGMLVHPRKRTKHGRRVQWPSGPREHRFRARR